MSLGLRSVFGASALWLLCVAVSVGQTVDPARQTPAAGPAQALPASARPVGDTITIAAVGDVMIGSTFPDDANLPPNDGRDLMTPFAAILHDADLTFGNLEGPMLEGGVSTKCGPAPAAPADGSAAPKPNCFAFRMPPRYAEDLTAAGFRVMSVANNHAGDFGDLGRASTRRVLEGQGIQFAGSDREQFATTVVMVHGLRVGFAGFAHNDVVPNVNDLVFARKLVSELKARTDLVVVSFHGGGEGVDRQHVLPFGTTEVFLKEPRGDLRQFAHTVIDAGADLVLGHGPHVLRGMEVYKGHLIAYSMGNFCTYGMFGLHGETSLTAVFRITLGADGQFLHGQLYPGRQDKPGGPKLDPTGEAIRVVRGLSEEDFPASAPSIAKDGSFVPRTDKVSVLGPG